MSRLLKVLTHGIIQSSAKQGVAADALRQEKQIVASRHEEAEEGKRHGGMETADQGMCLHVMHLHQRQVVLCRQRASLDDAYLRDNIDHVDCLSTDRHMHACMHAGRLSAFCTGGPKMRQSAIVATISCHVHHSQD